MVGKYTNESRYHANGRIYMSESKYHTNGRAIQERK